MSWRDKVATQLELATKKAGERRDFVSQILFKSGDNLDERLVDLRIELEGRLLDIQDKSSDLALLIQALVVLLGSPVRLQADQKLTSGAAVGSRTKGSITSGRVRLFSAINGGDEPSYPRPITKGVVEVVDEDLEDDDSADDYPDPSFRYLPDPEIAEGGNFQYPLEDLAVDAKRPAR
jgi:hypothetical protein